MRNTKTGAILQTTAPGNRLVNGTPASTDLFGNVGVKSVPPAPESARPLDDGACTAVKDSNPASVFTRGFLS